MPHVPLPSQNVMLHTRALIQNLLSNSHVVKLANTCVQNSQDSSQENVQYVTFFLAKQINFYSFCPGQMQKVAHAKVRKHSVKFS